VGNRHDNLGTSWGGGSAPQKFPEFGAISDSCRF